METTSAPQTVTLSNTGDGPLSITSVDASGDFAESDDCGASVAPGASCTLSVTFTPTATGTRTGNVTITSNAPGSPHTVQLSGTGTDFSLSADPASRTVTAGQSASYTVSVNPVSGFNQTVSLSCTGAPQRANCSLSSSSATPDGTNPASVTVTFTTTARGMAAPMRLPDPPLGDSAPRHGVPLAALLLGLLMLATLAARRRRRLYVSLAMSTLLVGLWVSCGGGGGAPTPPQIGTPAGTYTLTVTATTTVGTRPVSRSTELSLRVN